MCMSDEPGGTPQEIQVSLPPEMFGGVWANFATVTHTEHEFTIDFIRVDGVQRSGMVTARVNVSPLFITQLQAALNRNWEQYAKKALPPEAQDE